MNIRIWIAPVLVLALYTMIGCSDQQDNALARSGDAVPVASKKKSQKPAKNRQVLDDSAVLIRCGTNEFTMGEAKKIADLRAKLLAISMSKGRDVKCTPAILARTLAAMPYGFPRECAITEFAHEKGIKAGEVEISLMRSRAMQNAKQGFLSWPAFRHKLSAEEAKTLDGRIAVEALAESVRLWHATNMPVKVTDEEITQYRQRLRNYNIRAQATNDMIFVQATNIWRELNTGLDFSEAVANYSNADNDAENGEWGEFSLEYFKDEPALRAALAALEPGQHTPPIEGDNGLMIVRLDDIDTENPEQPTYTLSRIFLHLPEFYPELDDASFAKEIREARQNRHFNEFITELSKKRPITYPSGEFVFEDAKRTAAQPVMF